MKNIITAMGNPKINEELKKENTCNILVPDIQYQDGVIEILEKNSNINILILNSILPGEKNLEEFINKIQEINLKIEIIIILEKESAEKKNFLISKGIFNIFYDNEITIQEIIFLIKENNNKIPNEINEEIKLLKEMILNNKNKRRKFFGESSKLVTGEKQGAISRNNKNKLINNIKKTIKLINLNNILLIKNKLIRKNQTVGITGDKIISIIGAHGTGKTIISYLLANIIKNKKILLIDFDFLNNNIATIFEINKKVEINTNKLNINDLIINKNNNLDLISEFNLLIKEKINKNQIKNIINELIPKYDLIIIDTPSDPNNTYLKLIMEISDKNILTIIPNILGIKESQKLLEKFVHKWKIPKNRINVLLNKNTVNSIDDLILNNLFSEFNILGKIKLNNKYDLIINKNKYILNKKIKKEYLNITNKLI